MELLEIIVKNIPAIDNAAIKVAAEREDQLTKPIGSLGRLEELVIKIAGMRAEARPSLDKKKVIVFASDHGVALEGVGSYPQEVTMQMLMNFRVKGAAINVLAAQAGADISLVDMGVACPYPEADDVILRKLGPGTANIAVGPAMDRATAVKALETGMELALLDADKGMNLLAVGEMGIGNTTSSAAIICAVTGNSPDEVTGTGAGLAPEKLQHKKEIVKKALAVNSPDVTDGIDVLASLGGFEIGAMAGAIVAAASRRIPVVIDGIISSAAALIASLIAPDSVNYMIAGHRSQVPGHSFALAKLGLEPYLELDMRLGEGTGAVLCFNIVEAACRTLDEMATFAEAGVSEANDEN
ncbi:MAG: nicotinate-nucleotide--dimethylbenzimidazole phosphoribosyltransferase [Spirochaetales bacterium]|uniref:Nicotinate-nucleotide--dimethylbenzimidazole phosphoribosyltransferase n=1 Tax=Candidatus Thalassospirochaeta sargassi TaxID=3119039 RepID=A0AAJ1IEL7_9SPIO|nr:nicotinate-nucleotide--dimethylbenzimidazole phosphoribosyltransferase [Spirochaetales bacterium]